MSGFGWVSPGILAGLAALALPILIHYLTRARPRRIRYPTFRFLVEAGSGRQALHRLRVFLILALRCLAIAALVLLFARPFLRTRGAETEPGAAQRVALVVDASLSMRAAVGGASLFAKARAEAANTLRGLEPGSAAAVIFMGAKPRATLPALSQNLAALHQALLEAEPTLELGDPARAIALAQRMLGETGVIYVFSDFQRTNWSAVDLADLKGLTCFLRPVADTIVGNVAIRAIGVSPAEPTAGEPIELTASVFNCTPTQRREAVRLDVPGVTQEVSVELPPFRTREAVFTFSLPAPGPFAGKVSLGPDDLSEDNTRYFRVRVRRALEVLVLSDADAGDVNSAAFFVATALAPSREAGTGLTVIRRHSQDADRRALETASAFVIVAPAQLPGEATEVIARRVADGALLLCLLDGPTSPGILNGLLGASNGAVAPPFRLLRQVRTQSADGEPFDAARVAYGPLKLFANPGQGDLASLRVRRHFLTEALEGREDEVLVHFADGSAALALSPAGRGAAVYVNFPLAPSGGNVAGSPLFPALLHELLRALRRGEETHAATPGHPWQLDVPQPLGGAGEGACQVLGPDGKPVEALVVSRGRTVRLSLPPADRPGHYRVRRQGVVAAVGVVNVDPRESDTRPMPTRTLAETAGGGQAGAVAVLDDEGKLVHAGKARALWPWLAALACVALACEMLLLSFWRRGPRRAVARHAGGIRPTQEGAA